MAKYKFKETSPIVLSWVHLITHGKRELADVPNIYNLRTLVTEIIGIQADDDKEV